MVCANRKHLNPLSANVEYTPHESGVTCSRCGVSYRGKILNGKKFQKSKTYNYQRFLSADNSNNEMTINLEILSQRTF